MSSVNVLDVKASEISLLELSIPSCNQAPGESPSLALGEGGGRVVSSVLKKGKGLLSV